MRYGCGMAVDESVWFLESWNEMCQNTSISHPTKLLSQLAIILQTCLLPITIDSARRSHILSRSAVLQSRRCAKMRISPRNYEVPTARAVASYSVKSEKESVLVGTPLVNLWGKELALCIFRIKLQLSFANCSLNEDWNWDSTNFNQW